METTQIIIISILAIIQLIALSIILQNAQKIDNIRQFYFGLLFTTSSVVVFMILIITISVRNKHYKQESIYPKYEMIKEPVYRLKEV